MNLIKRLLVGLSIRPYKVVTLDTGLIVEHYKNGRLIANKRKKK